MSMRPVRTIPGTCISVQILAASSTIDGKSKILSFELVMPRYVLAELNTHRVFSRNSASSRAVPVSKVLSMVWHDPVIPIRWGKNISGMQDAGELSHTKAFFARIVWVGLSKIACIASWSLSKLGLHKQYANRLTEPWQQHKVVVTSTEWDNFFALRAHPAAQPEFGAMAALMKEEYYKTWWREIPVGSWHLPYYGKGFYSGAWEPSDTDETIDRFGFTLDQARKISASCCAQISYRKNDDSIEKAEQLYDRLVAGEPKHASPFEHQATPIQQNAKLEWGTGITHQLKDGRLCSGNFVGWIQLRQILDSK